MLCFNRAALPSLSLTCEAYLSCSFLTGHRHMTTTDLLNAHGYFFASVGLTYEQSAVKLVVLWYGYSRAVLSYIRRMRLLVC